MKSACCISFHLTNVAIKNVRLSFVIQPPQCPLLRILPLQFLLHPHSPFSFQSHHPTFQGSRHRSSPVPEIMEERLD